MNNSIFNLLTGMPHEKLPSHDFGWTLLAMAEIGKALADRRGMVESLRQLLERKGIPHDFLSDDFQGLTNAIEENVSFRQALEETGMLHKFIELASLLEETKPEPGIQLMSEHLAPLMEGWTPLHHAAKDDAPETAAALIETGTNVNVMDANSNTPLHVAALRNAHETAAILLKHNADANAKNDEGHSPLHVAALINAHETAAMLLKHNADANAKNEKDDTPLHVAALRNAHETAAVLLKHDADPNAKNADGTAREPSGESYLLEITIGPTLPGSFIFGRRYDAISTPLHGAALKNAHETGVELIRHGAAVNAKDKDDATPLHYAVDGNAHKIARTLLNHGADTNAKSDRDLLSPLHCTILADKYEIAEMLLKRGADINAKDWKGYTPLHYAISFNTDKTAEVLDRYGASLSVKAAEKGHTALHIAVYKIASGSEGNQVAYRMLTSLHNLCDMKNNQGDTPLHIVAEYASRKDKDESVEYNKEIMRTLCDLPQIVDNVSAKNNEGDTPLHIAMRRWFPLSALEIISGLLRHGADPNVKNNNGDTPLHVAASRVHELTHPLIRMLIEHGADVKVKSNDGKRPSDIMKDWSAFHNLTAHHQGRAPERPRKR